MNATVDTLRLSMGGALINRGTIGRWTNLQVTGTGLPRIRGDLVPDPYRAPRKRLTQSRQISIFGPAFVDVKRRWVVA